jgi:hypothetical protein
MNTAIKLFDGLNVSSSELHIKVPVDYSFTEIFAFCTDYSAASIFWPNHATDLNKMHAEIIGNMMKKEKELNLEEQDSYLSNKNESAHLLASIVGIVLINKYPKDWVQKLLGSYNI